MMQSFQKSKERLVLSSNEHISMAMSTTTGGGLRAPLRPLVHVGGGVDRRTGYHEERAALREALERGTATIHGDRMLSPVVVTMSAASIDVHADARV